MEGVISSSNIQTRTEKLNKIMVLHVLLMETLNLSAYERRHLTEVVLCLYHYEKTCSRMCLICFIYPSQEFQSWTNKPFAVLCNNQS
jgi:hypothetical protein